MKEKKAKLGEVLKVAFKVSPGYMFLAMLNALISAAQILTNVILPRYLIDELTQGANMQVSNLLIFGGAIVGCNIMFALLVKLMTWKIDVSTNKMVWNVLKVLSQKITSVEYNYLENPYYLDLKERAVFAIRNQGALYSLVQSITNFVKNLVTVISLLVVMLQLSWILVIALLVTIILMVFIQAGFSKYLVELSQKLLPINRRYGYYSNLCFDEKIQKDSRLYGMSTMIGNRITHYNREVCSWFAKMQRKTGVMEGLYYVISTLQAALSYGYVGLRCITDVLGNKISIGAMTMYVSSAISFSTSVYGLGESAVQLDRALAYLQPFMELLNLPDAADSGKGIAFDGDIESICFNNVSFSYPKSDKLVLDNVSFSLHKGQKISIVGLNGAGKTTIVKLLCRLYNVEKGEILVNGVNIADYDYNSYLKAISAVFQDFKLFAFTIAENITCSELETSAEQAELLAADVGVKEKIDTLPNGIKSLIGKNLDKEGVEMSGGEKQKIAIARALCKNASLVVLDEPTSALDPLAEAEIYDQFNKLVGDKTAIYISHRMSSSVFCDKVLIIDGGKVADYDTHHNLMQKTDGLYYKMFSTQAENYKLTKYIKEPT